MTQRAVRRARSAFAVMAVVVGLAGCIPVDTGSTLTGQALLDIENTFYAIRDETALLQAQIDSLREELYYQDSLLRDLANLTGHPMPPRPPRILPP